MSKLVSLIWLRGKCLPIIQLKTQFYLFIAIQMKQENCILIFNLIYTNSPGSFLPTEQKTNFVSPFLGLLYYEYHSGNIGELLILFLLYRSAMNITFEI